MNKTKNKREHKRIACSYLKNYSQPVCINSTSALTNSHNIFKNILGYVIYASQKFIYTIYFNRLWCMKILFLFFYY